MFTFKVYPDHGEPFELKAGSRDVYVWEKTGRGRTLKSFAENVSLQDAYAIAHIAGRRQQLVTCSLEEFAATCDLDFEEDEPADPSRPAPTDSA